MTDPAVTDKVHQAQANALLSLLRAGKPLNAWQMEQLQAALNDRGDAPPTRLPWLHDSLVSLATAIGCSVRSLENWRPRGAPLPETGPFDELAVRLWIAAERVRGRPMKTLREADRPLAIYAAIIATARPPRGTSPRAAGDSLKRKQSKFLDIKMAERQKLAQQQATNAFLAVLGRLDQLFEREVGAQLPQQLYDCAWDKPSAAATPLIQQILRDTYRAVRRRALGR